MNLLTLDMYYNLTSNNDIEKKYYLIYCRKSQENEDSQIQSIDDQLKIAERIRTAKNLQILETFTEARSAKMPGRPEFNRMIEMIDTRQDIKGIICWKANRLSRNPQDEGLIRQRLLDGRIHEIVTPEKTYTQVDSDFMMAIEGAQAQRFISDLKRDIRRGVQSKLDKGIAPFLAPPGYRNTPEKRQGERDIQPDPVYFPLMKQIFGLALTGNYSVEQLHEKVKEMKIKNSSKRIICRAQLYKALKNPFYTGTRFIFANKLYTNGIHKPMITDDQYDLLQEILIKKSKPRAYSHRESFLTGLLRCGECGGMITAEIHRKKYKSGKIQEFAYYRCTKKIKKCSQPYIPALELERQVLEYLKSVKLSTRFTEWAIKWLNVMRQNQQEIRDAKIAANRKEYDETRKKLDRIDDLMIEGAITAKAGLAKKQELEDEKLRLNNVFQKIDALADEWSNLSIKTFLFAKTAQEKFANGTIDQQKTILRVIGSNLLLKNGKLDITIRTPFEYIQKVVMELKNKDTSLEPVESPTMPVISSNDAFIVSSNPALYSRSDLN